MGNICLIEIRLVSKIEASEVFCSYRGLYSYIVIYSFFFLFGAHEPMLVWINSEHLILVFLLNCMTCSICQYHEQNGMNQQNNDQKLEALQPPFPLKSNSRTYRPSLHTDLDFFM